jgi:hypothetical protein
MSDPGTAGQRRDDERDRDERDFRRGAGPQQRAPVSTRPRDQQAARVGADQEAAKREQRRRQRESGRADDRERGEHHVPRHVRDEDPAEREDRHRVHHAGHDGQQEQQPAQRAERRVGDQ